MTVVLTNDDGVHADGLTAMRGALRAAGFPVVVIAPKTNQSGGALVRGGSVIRFRALRDGMVSVTPVSYDHDDGPTVDLYGWAAAVVDAASARTC